MYYVICDRLHPDEFNLRSRFYYHNLNMVYQCPRFFLLQISHYDIMILGIMSFIFPVLFHRVPKMTCEVTEPKIDAYMSVEAYYNMIVHDCPVCGESFKGYEQYEVQTRISKHLKEKHTP